jgi:peptide chain release factor subunit 1
MMHEKDLQELAELVSKKDLILSLYLNVDPQRRSTEEPKLALRQLLARATELGAAAADVQHIERFFDHEYDRQGRGVACFSCQSLGFWRGHTLLVPTADAVYVGLRPLITPLSDLWDEYDRFGVIMLDREGARVFVYHLGALVDSAGTFGAEVKRHKQGGWSSQKHQRSEDQEAKHNLKDAAEWAKGYLGKHKVKQIVLSGTEGNLALFRDLLPRPLQDQVVGQINLDMSTSPSEVWESAYQVAQESHRRSENELLAQVITAAHKGGTGAIGLSDTLSALKEGRVHQLLADPTLHLPGRYCTACTAMVIESATACPYCGSDMAETADVVNLAIQRAFEAGVKVSTLEKSEQLAEVGGIAAVLRY